MLLLAQSIPGQLTSGEFGGWIFCMVGVIATVAGSLGVVVLWQKVTRGDVKDAAVTVGMLNSKIETSEGVITRRFTEFEQRLTAQLGKVETHELKLEEYKHETRSLLLKSIHEVDIRLAQLAESAKRFSENDFSTFIRRSELEDKLMEIKDFRTYTHSNIHELRNVIGIIGNKVDIILTMMTRKIPDPTGLSQSTPEVKLAQESGGVG